MKRPTDKRDRKPDPREFKLPDSMDEAEEMCHRYLTEIQDIQLQLGTRAPRDIRGNYDDWKRRSKVALAIRLREYREVRKWMKDTRKQSLLNSKPELDPKKPITFVRESYRLLTNMKNDGVHLKDEEKTFLNEMRELLQDIPT